MMFLKKHTLAIKLIVMNIILFVATFHTIMTFNEIKQKELSFYIRSKVNLIYDELHSFTQYYINSENVFIEKGIHHFNSVGVVNPEPKEIRKFSDQLNLLSLKLKDLVNDDYWTLAVIDKDQKDILYCLPLRVAHIKDLYEYDLDLLGEIAKRNNIPKTYEEYLKSTRLKLTLPYKEKFSHEQIRSIILPIYIKNNMSALLILDVKCGILKNWVSEFNNSQWTIYSTSKGTYYKQLLDLELRYLNNGETLPIYLNYIDIIKFSLLISFLISTSLFSLYKLLSNILNLIQLDSMTKCFRRDYGEKKFKNKLISNKSIFIFDIDHFKKINDTHGHDVGDQVIRTAAAIIKSNIRKSEQLYRWGGEEFVVILNITDPNIVLKKAEQLRQAIEGQTELDINFTISIGCTLAHNMTLDESIKIADQALYTAKNNGRNKVVVK
ncbi:putative diguanylate cyclase YcdT domain protein [Photobacterium leiognathi lrivu.4.1]|uniref:diguanylate cyclase n=1 Tax=Photobacterium leiognathi lrivu.4.1 TaxID=1248232 RepID=V5F8Z7_PHOLE|nr:GGDEF domain-containing protein [Photobacterium leiognathi]GAD31954.1 putative diguanylate cyclase YcdT domain protein [Photobacterium leiognathi lrivu.4.1]